MKTLKLVQGSPEWAAHRATSNNASDAPAMMGVSKYKTRDQLLRERATGFAADVSQHTQKLFDRGHAAEAAIRPHVEKLIGDDLYPATGVSDEFPWMSASFDGITMDETVIFEHKLLNAELFRAVTNGEELDPHYYWQLEQQLIVSGASKAVFVVSDGTPENMAHLWYTPVPGRREALLAGWAQFEKDLAAYVPQEAKAEIVAAPVASLPAIVYEIERGTMALSSNLPAFRAATEALIERTKAPLVTDQDFADRDALCKKMREAETMLKAKADEVVGQIADVATFSRELKDLAEMFRTTALASEKLVAAEKTNRRNAIQQGGEQALTKHIATLQARFAGRVQMPAYRADFAGAIKGKRTLESIQNAVDTVLAQGKIETNAMADLIDANLRSLDILASDHLFLFNDLQQIVTKQNGDFCLLVKARVEEHKVKEAAKVEAAAEAAREKIRREEQAKAEAEARAKADAERREREQAEAARRAAERQEAEAAARAEAARREAELEAAALSEAPPTAVEVAPQAPPATPQVTAAKPTPAKATRPSDDQIIEALALHFRVHEMKVIEWLHEIDLVAASKKAAEEFAS